MERSGAGRLGSSAGSPANDGSKLDQKDSLILGREME